MIILFAPQIHTGGGQVLLNSILSKIEFSVVAFVDHRFAMDVSFENKSITFIKIKSNLFARLAAEYQLFRVTKKAKSVFCFSSLPPLFKLHWPVTIFFKNNILNIIVKCFGVNILK